MCGKKITMSQPMIYSSVYYLLFSLQFQLKISPVSVCIPVVRNSSQKKLYVDDEIYIAYFIATYTDVPRDETKNCTSICSFIITFLTFLLWCSLVVVVTSAFLLVIIIIIGIEMGSKTCEKLIYNLCPICNTNI